MAGYFILCVLACFGLMSGLWAALGWLLPGDSGAVLVCADVPEEGILSRYRWLRSLGFLRCPLVAVSEERYRVLPEEVEICGREELLPRLEQEWKLYHGTGNGDPAGRHQRRGISEL